MEDANGKLRPREDYQAAFDCITREIVHNSMALAKDGQPLMMHYIVIREVLMDFLAALDKREGDEPRTV
jgi:hypothetical protein